MDRDTAKMYIRQNVKCTDYLEKSKNGMYCCPFCGSGHGPKGTGAVKYYPETNTICCFGECSRKSYDVIDLYQQETGADYNTALQQLAAEIGITIDKYHDAAADFSTQDAAGAPQRPATDADGKIYHETAKKPERGAGDATEVFNNTAANYTAYYRACRQRIVDPTAVAYLNSRGISTETAARYWIGFDPAADPASNPGGQGDSCHPCPRIIIPTSESHYVGRSIDSATPAAFKKINNKGGKPGIFNKKALYAQDVQEVFITEGAFDALSFLEAGSDAVALNSTSNAAALVKMLEEQPTTATLILCLDNDEAGKKATDELRSGLQRLNTCFIVATSGITGGYKDPNEHLQADRESFLKAVEVEKRRAAARPDNVEDYITQLMGDDLEKFKSDIATGFSNLDAATDGLYDGLYCIAAISSLGKTTFASQIADQIAAAGHDVLFFSLEQSRLELVSKSLARITAELDPDTAVTSMDIRKSRGGKAAAVAVKEYVQRVHDRISIIEGNFNCNLTFIRDYIRQYISRNNTRPVIFIDYLQVLQPETDGNRQQTTKEAVDVAITELKRLSRELGITIFIISSVNRANYLTPIAFESLKESGGIEFTCDVIWGLQLACLNEPLFESATKITEKRKRVNAAKCETPRKVKLCCLKNRYGVATFECYFDYFPANDYFRPATIDFDDEPTTKRSSKRM